MNNKISIYNPSGCSDPTAHEALTNIMRGERGKKRYRRFVYILARNTKNAERDRENALAQCRHAMDQARFPIAPNLYLPHFMDNLLYKGLTREFRLQMLRVCSEVWVFGSWINQAMSAEIAEAKQQGITVKYFNSKFEEDFGGIVE